MFNQPGVPESPEEAAAHRAALLQSPEERGLAKQTAREACSGEELALLQCYKDGSFIACTAARSAFWQCYKKHRGFQKTLLEGPSKAVETQAARLRQPRMGHF